MPVMIKIPSILLFVLMFAGSVAFAQGNSISMIQVNEFGNNPGNLKMYVHAYEQERTTSLKPLVIVLHGCGQSADEVAKLTGWNKLGDLNDFIVVYPQQKFINNVSNCFNWFSNANINKGQGESESIYQMILYMRRHYAIDSSRIFITGLSAGAAMSVVMMATHPETFAAGAIFAGGAYKLATNVFASAGVMAGTKKIDKDDLVQLVTEQTRLYKGRYPKMIIYQGMNDYVVNHKNAALLIDQWTGLNHCDNVPDKTEHAFMGIADINRMDYTDNSGKTVVSFYEVANIGHRLLVKPGPAKDEGGETGIYGADRGFHSTYQTAKDFGILKE